MPTNTAAALELPPPSPAAIGILLLIGLIFLITRRWFWCLVFLLGGLASCFTMIACIIHFQILAAVGFFVLMGICWGILGAIADS